MDLGTSISGFLNMVGLVLWIVLLISVVLWVVNIITDRARSNRPQVRRNFDSGWIDGGRAGLQNVRRVVSKVKAKKKHRVIGNPIERRLKAVNGDEAVSDDQ